MILADKFFSDEFLKNTDYALVGGISTKEANVLEHELLKLLEFDLFIDEEKTPLFMQDEIADDYITNIMQ